MSHQEQHFAGIHYRGLFVPGMTFYNDYDHHAVPLGYRYAPNLSKTKHCVVCDSAMFIYLHYPFEKRLRTIWKCRKCDRLFVFIDDHKRRGPQMQTIKLSSPGPVALKSEYIAHGLEVTCPSCKTTFVMTPTSPVCPGCQDRVRIEFYQE